MIPRMDKGPLEMLRALRSGDPEAIAEAKEFQRESFRAQFGCYPDELVLGDVCDCGCGSQETFFPDRTGDDKHE